MISMFIWFCFFSFSSLHPNLVSSQARNVRTKCRQYLEIVTEKCRWLLCCCKNSLLILTSNYKSRKTFAEYHAEAAVSAKPRGPGALSARKHITWLQPCEG